MNSAKRPDPAPCTSPPCSRAFKLLVEFAKKRGIELLPREEGKDGRGKDGDSCWT